MRWAGSARILGTSAFTSGYWSSSRASTSRRGSRGSSYPVPVLAAGDLPLGGRRGRRARAASSSTRDPSRGSRHRRPAGRAARGRPAGRARVEREQLLKAVAVALDLEVVWKRPRSRGPRPGGAPSRQPQASSRTRSRGASPEARAPTAGAARGRPWGRTRRASPSAQARTAFGSAMRSAACASRARRARRRSGFGGFRRGRPAKRANHRNDESVEGEDRRGRQAGSTAISFPSATARGTRACPASARRHGR